MKNILIILTLIILSSCKNDEFKPYQFSKTIDLKGVNPIGITANKNNEFFISDGDHNRIIKLENEKFSVVLDSVERPMHLHFNDNKLMIPSYGNDEILIVENSDFNLNNKLNVTEKLDAPASVFAKNNFIAIADFYSHSVILKDENSEFRIGKKGKENGQFHYPTDVHLANNKLYVADAYNHRIQVFDLKGNHLNTFGEQEEMNATTGIFVDDNFMYCTDFENSRVLIFDLNGLLLEIIDTHLNKPTDVFVKDNTLYITNYKGENLSVFEN